jgi:hypothetical protein
MEKTNQELLPPITKYFYKIAYSNQKYGPKSQRGLHKPGTATTAFYDFADKVLPRDVT